MARLTNAEIQNMSLKEADESQIYIPLKHGVLPKRMDVLQSLKLRKLQIPPT